MRKFVFALSAMMLASAAQSAVPVYPNIGTPIVSLDRTYDDYLSPGRGMVYAYFLGKEAGYSSTITLLVNGVATPESPIFPNQTTPRGTKAPLGIVQVGDSLELLLKISSPADVAGTILSSKRENNPDGMVHIFARAYGGGDFGVPLGNYIYVGFEDIVGPRDVNFVNDWDYDDHRFIFQIAPIPEPATWAMMMAGFGLVGLASRRRGRRQVSA